MRLVFVSTVTELKLESGTECPGRLTDSKSKSLSDDISILVGNSLNYTFHGIKFDKKYTLGLAI